MSGTSLAGEVIPMAMKAMTRELVRCDAELRKLAEQLHDHTWDPDELACAREDIDVWLERRFSLQEGTARGGHRG